MNGQYIRNSSVERITQLAIPYLIKAGFITDEDVINRYDWIKTIVSSIQEKISVVAEVVEKAEFLFNNEVKPENEETQDYQYHVGSRHTASCPPGSIIH